MRRERVGEQADEEEDAGSPMFTAMRAIMRPRRLRNSMTLVVIMPALGIGDPRRSRECPVGAVWGAWSGAGVPWAGRVVMPGPPVSW